MATIQEIIAKRKELGANATNVEARQALMGTPTATPVTPAVPTTPTPVTPQPIVNAPVDQNTGLSKPIEPTQPTPVQTPVQTPFTPTETPAQTPQTPFQQAQAESEKIKAQNEAKLAENQQKAQLAEQARQQGITEQNTALANNEGAILNTLKTGGVIPETVKTSPFYKNAQQTYNKLQQYSTYSTADIVTAMNQGSILPGTGLYNEMMKDPALKKKLTDAQVYRQANPAPLAEVTQNASNDILSNNPTLNSALQDGSISMDEYNSMTNNPAVIAKAQDVEAKTNKYNKLKAEYDAIEDETRAEYQDKGGSGAYIDSIIADRQKSKYKALQLASGEMETATGTLTDLKSQASTLFNTNLELYKEKQKTSEALKLSQAQFDQKLAQQAQLTNDPTTAITTMIDEYKKLGIPFTRSTQQVIADFQTSGKPLATYLSELQGQIQSKPEYKRYQAIQTGQMSDAEKLQATQAFQAQSDIRNFAQQKELAKYNNDLNRQEFLFKIENDPEQKAKTVALEAQLNSNKSLFDVLGKNVGTYEGNRGYDLAGALGDPLPAGGNWTVKSVDTAGEQVGSIFIGGKGSKPYGNTVVMEDGNGNEIRYSHLQNIGVKPGDVLGFGDIVGNRGNTGNVMGANGEKLTAEQLKAGRGAHLDVEIKSNGKLLSNADQVNFLKGLKAGGGTSSASLPLYRAYMEDNKLPSKDALAGLGMTSEQFANNASTGYDQFLRSKEQEINSTYPTLQIQFTPSYASLSATQREKLNESMTKIGDIDMRLEKLKKLFADNGTEVLPTQAKKEMQSLKQQIILKAKEVENLGVLNGPDLGILESLIPETTGIMSGLFSFDDNTNTTLNSIQNNYRSDAKTKGINYGARIGFKGMDEPMQQLANKTQSNTAPFTMDTLDNEWLNFKP